MGLQEQSVAVKFAGGIETKSDSKTVPSAKLLVLENGVFTRAISIQKRNGYSALSSAIDGSVSLISSGKRLASRDDELLQLTTNRCYSHQGGTDQWTDAGPALSVIGTDRPAVHNGSNQTVTDHATAGGVTVYAWEDNLRGVYFTTVDAASGSIYRAPTLLDSGGTRPRCVAVGNVLHIYFVVTTELHVAVINPTIPAATVVPTVLVTDIDATNPGYDACPTTRTTTPAAIAWRENGSTAYRLGLVDQSGVLGSPATGHLSAIRSTDLGITNAVRGQAIAVAYHFVDGATQDMFAVAYVADTSSARAADIFYLGDASNPLLLGASYTMGVGQVDSIRIAATWQDDNAANNGTLWCAYEDRASLFDSESTRHFVCVNSATFPGGVIGTERTQRSVGIASRAWCAGSTTDTFCTFVHTSTYFNTYVSLRLSDFSPIGRFMPGSASGFPDRAIVPSAHVVSSVAAMALPYKTRVQSVAADKFTETAIRRITLDYADTDARQTAQLGQSLYMAGACPLQYDGRAWTEHGFHVGPELITTSTNAVGGSLTPSATYLYRAWYEWTDAQGEVHRGPTSVGTQVTMGVADTRCTLTLPMLRITTKVGVRVCVARSLNGDSSRLFRITSADPSVNTGSNRYVASVTTADSDTLIDDMSDATLANQEPIYTTAGILSNDPASLGPIVVTGKNRLFYSDQSNGKNVRYSQELAEGFGVECAPELVVTVDPFGGDVTALAVMDDVVVVFKEFAIFAFNGNGPLPNGDTATSAFSSPALITSDVGCTAPSSIALTPAGLVFKSAKGIYLLDRGRSVSYVGAPAEAYNAQTVTRAIAMPDRSQVVFVTDSGVSLLYDFLFGQWSTFTNHQGRDAVVVNGSFHYLRTDNRVFRETLGAYSDAGVRIRLRLETAWIHLWDHLQGLQRFWKLLLLGTWVSKHQLGFQYRTDFETEWTDNEWLDATGDTSSTGWITGGGANSIGVDPLTGSAYGDGAYGAGAFGGTAAEAYAWRMGLHVAGSSIQFRFEDFEKDGLAGASFELTEMLITGGVMRRDNRPFTAARSK